MSEELNITIREAIPDDAAQLLTVMRQIGQETEFLVMDEAGIELPEELLALQLAEKGGLATTASKRLSRCCGCSNVSS